MAAKKGLVTRDDTVAGIPVSVTIYNDGTFLLSDKAGNRVTSTFQPSQLAGSALNFGGQYGAVADGVTDNATALANFQSDVGADGVGYVGSGLWNTSSLGTWASTATYVFATGALLLLNGVPQHRLTYYHPQGTAYNVLTETFASGSSTTTTGSITSASTSLTVVSATGWSVGMGISIAGAGASGALLVSQVVAISGTTFTLADAAGTTVSGATVGHDDEAAIAEAYSTAHTNGGTVYLPRGNYVLNTAPTTYANVTSRFDDGTVLEPASGVTVTINGTIQAPYSQIFGGSGAIAFNTNKVSEAYPEWWGATSSSSDNSGAFNAALTAMGNAGGGIVTVHPGNWTMAANVTIPAGVLLKGMAIPRQLQSASTWVTRIVMQDYQLILNGTGASIDLLFVDGSGNTTAAASLLVAAGVADWYVGIVFAQASGTAIGAVQFGEVNGAVCVNGYVKRLITEGTVVLENCTQSRFDEVVVIAALKYSLLLDGQGGSASDNNSWGHVQLTSPSGSTGAMLQFGTTSTASATYGNHFEYMDIAMPASGWTTITVNTPLSVSSGDDFHTISHLHVEGAASYTFNNSSYGAIRANLTIPNSLGFKTSQPSLPSSTGSTNYVQNQTAFSMRIYQPTSTTLGTHIVDMASNDYTVPEDPPFFDLQPGEKVYYATAVPGSWKWYGV